jgi:hypothetical protein
MQGHHHTQVHAAQRPAANLYCTTPAASFSTTLHMSPLYHLQLTTSRVRQHKPSDTCLHTLPRRTCCSVVLGAAAGAAAALGARHLGHELLDVLNQLLPVKGYGRAAVSAAGSIHAMTCTLACLILLHASHLKNAGILRCVQHECNRLKWSHHGSATARHAGQACCSSSTHMLQQQHTQHPAWRFCQRRPHLSGAEMR